MARSGRHRAPCHDRREPKGSLRLRLERDFPEGCSKKRGRNSITIWPGGVSADGCSRNTRGASLLCRAWDAVWVRGQQAARARALEAADEVRGDPHRAPPSVIFVVTAR